MAMHFNRHYCGKCGLTYMLENPGKDPNADKNKKKDAVKEEAAAPAKGEDPLPLTRMLDVCLRKDASGVRICSLKLEGNLTSFAIAGGKKKK